MDHPTGEHWAQRTSPAAEYRRPAADDLAPPQNNLYSADSEIGEMQDQLSAHSGDTETQMRPARELVQFTIHIGNVQEQSEQAIMKYVGGFGTIDQNVLVSDGDRRSLRLLFTTIFHRLRELQINLPQVFPQARLKIISSGEVLTRKVYIKFGVGHHKEQLKDFFSAFGTVRKIEFKFDPKTKKSRHFGYITFSDQEDATRVLNLRRHCIGGKFVHCFPCKPFDISSSPTPQDTNPGRDHLFASSEGFPSQIGTGRLGSNGQNPFQKVGDQHWQSSFGDGRQNMARKQTSINSDLQGPQKDSYKSLKQQHSENLALSSRNSQTTHFKGSDWSKKASECRREQYSNQSGFSKQGFYQDQMSQPRCGNSANLKFDGLHMQSSTLPSLACRDISRTESETHSYLKYRITCLIENRHKDPSNIVFNIRRARKDSSAVPILTLQH